MAVLRLFEGVDGPGAQVTDTAAYSLSVEFYVTEAANLTDIHFWASGTVTGSDHAVRLYQVDSATAGTLMTGSSTALPTPLVSGWNTATLAAPIALTPNQRYRAAVYFTTDNGYTATGSYWTSGDGAAGITSGVLVAPNVTDATGNDQGSFTQDSDSMPTDSFGGGNYWVDVSVVTAGAAVLAATTGDATATAVRDDAAAVVATTTSAADVAAASDDLAPVQRQAWVVSSAAHAVALARRTRIDQALIAAGVLIMDATSGGVTAASTAAVTATVSASSPAAASAATAAAGSVTAVRSDVGAITATITASTTATAATGDDASATAGTTATGSATASASSPAGLTASTAAAIVATVSVVGGPDRVTVTVQTPTRTGQSLTFTAANNAGNAFSNDGRTILIFRNAGGSTRTVTVGLSGELDGIDLDIAKTVTVPAGVDVMTAVWPRRRYARADDSTWVDFDAVTDLSLCAVAI